MGRDISVWAETRVVLQDALDEIKTEELRDELSKRYERIPDDLHDEVSRAAPHDVPLIIERHLRPKWSSREICLIDYNEAMGRGISL